MFVSEVCVLHVTGFAKRNRIPHLYKLFQKNETIKECANTVYTLNPKCMDVCLLSNL